MSGRDPPRVDSVCLLQEIAKLREGVAADARDRRPAECILGDEILHDVVAETRFEIDYVMRNSQLLTNASCIIHRIERAAWAVRNIVAMAEQFHRRTDDVVAPLDEESRRDGRIDPTGHCDQHPLAAHDVSAAARRRAFATRVGNTSRTRSIHSSVVRAPRLSRIAALARSGRTPSAVSTCEGLILPLWQADPPEAAIPLRSSAMSSDSLSVPGTDRLSMCGARRAPCPWITTSGTRAVIPASRRSLNRSRRSQ